CRQNKDEHCDTLQMQHIRQSCQHMCHRDSRATEQHQAAASPAIYGAECYKRERCVHRACDDDEEQCCVHAKACMLENIIGIVEETIDTAPLLQDRKSAADEQNLQELGFEKICNAPARNFLCGDCLPDFFRSRRRITVTADAREDFSRAF